METEASTKKGKESESAHGSDKVGGGQAWGALGIVASAPPHFVSQLRPEPTQGFALDRRLWRWSSQSGKQTGFIRLPP